MLPGFVLVEPEVVVEQAIEPDLESRNIVVSDSIEKYACQEELEHGGELDDDRQSKPTGDIVETSIIDTDIVDQDPSDKDRQLTNTDTTCQDGHEIRG